MSVVRCECYEPSLVLERVRACLAPLGGMLAFVSPGQRVLVKPNLLAATPPEAAITTHPAVVGAVVQLVKEAGGEPVVGDTPGANVPDTPGGLRRVYQATGLLALAEAAGVELNWDTTGVAVANPAGRLAKRLELIRPAVEADVVIALPKLKTHVLTTLSGATKVLFGAVPGLAKPVAHATFHDPDRFGDLLLDIITRLTPALVLMDAILALEGDGPGRGGRPRQVGALLAGADPIAVDLVACGLTGIDPLAVPPLRAARVRGWWDGASAPPTLGEDPTRLAVRDFVLPLGAGAGHRARMLPLARLLRPLALSLLSPRPVPDAGSCTGCGSCARTCPAGAIRMREWRGQRLAVVDQGACIRCYCCHELCPVGAVALRVSPAARLIRRLQPWILRGG